MYRAPYTAEDGRESWPLTRACADVDTEGRPRKADPTTARAERREAALKGRPLQIDCELRGKASGLKARATVGPSYGQAASFRSSWACFSAFLDWALALTSGLRRWMALWRSMRLSLAPLQEERSALVWTPVTLARRQLNSMAAFLLACRAARQSCSAVNGAQVSVSEALGARTPAVCRLAASFLSRSALEADGSSAAGLDFLTQWRGL